MYCSGCGKEVGAEEKFCQHCGQSVNGETSTHNHFNFPQQQKASQPIQAIEATSKRRKGLQRISAFIYLLSLLFIINYASEIIYPDFVARSYGIAYWIVPIIGVLLLFLGILRFIAGKSVAWWHHG